MTQAQLTPTSTAPSTGAAAPTRPGRRAPVDVEVVIPAYNEARRLDGSLAATARYLATRSWSSRIVVVDNGSADTTAGVARRAVTGVPVEVIGCAIAGKGAAVRRGMMTSAARYVGFVDADLATPIDALGEALAALEAGATAVIGSRYAGGAAILRKQPVARRLGGAAFRALARRMVPGVADTQCGFKFFERRAVQHALAGCAVTGFAFDVELLRGVQAQGGTVVELPVAWSDDHRSTLRPLRDGVPAFRAALTLWGARP
ncbi:glycosyltransferase [Actinokineospora globicatena]|uniref:glycosyltransferase n=1 Tax=Actinokineospora globicatena TaxID=103729 RepID=UPI0025543E4B|nr:glycosyltransferase [Actinokineospora globicatena]